MPSMPQGGTIALLRSMLPQLTKKERKTAEAILKNPSDVVHMSINDLADISGTAETTIFRLCKKLGFTGFQSFKITLATELFPSAALGYNQANSNDLAAEIFQNITQGLQDTLAILDPAALDQAVQAILNASRIHTYAFGISALVALDIESRFIRFGIPVAAYSDPHMQLSASVLLKPGDVIIAISHTGASRDLIESINVGKESGATVIAITSYQRSPLGCAADIVLCGRGREVKFRSEAMASRLIHLAIVDVLYAKMMREKPEPITTNMNRINQVVSHRKI